jgi:hypothetical protein
LLDRVTGLGDALRRARDGLRARLPAGLQIPETFEEWLAAAAALEAAEPSPAGAALALHYCQGMPRMRAGQLAPDAPHAALFHTPLDWASLPRLAGAIDRLYQLLDGAAEGGGARALGDPSPAAFRAARPTLAALYDGCYYGRFMPLLYGYPGDLAAMAAELAGGATVEEVIDRRLAAPLAHELSHLRPGRPALQPPYLDECVAAHLGLTILPELLLPAPGADNALFGAPWLTQVGQALSRAFGAGRVLAAHAGLCRWDEAIGAPLVEAAARIGWAEHRAARTLHFLPSAQRPEPWLKLIFLAAAGAPLDGHTLDSLAALPFRDVPAGPEAPADRALLGDALRAMCLCNLSISNTFRVTRRAPAGPIAIDLDACRVSTAASGCDPAPPAHLFPPATAARLRAAGVRGFTVTIAAGEGSEELAGALAAGAGDRSTPAWSIMVRSAR